MTPAELTEARQAIAAATPGPWAYRMGDIVQLTDGGKGYPLDYYPDSADVISRDRDGDRAMSDNDAEFIALARTALPAALDEIEERDRLHESALLPIRSALFARGFCGDGGLTAMVIRALEESQERGRVENGAVLTALLEASDALPPELEGTVAARVRLLTARAASAERDLASLRASIHAAKEARGEL